MARAGHGTDLALDLVARNESQQHIAAALAEGFAERQRRGTDRRRRMAAHIGIHVVIVERVRERAIDERGIMRLGPRIERNERHRPVLAAKLFEQERREILARTCDRHAEPVEQRVLCPQHRTVRKLARRQRARPAREITGRGKIGCAC